jgi:cytoskeletal protein RodZ
MIELWKKRMRKNKQHGFSPALVVIIVAAAALLGLIGWRVYEAMKPKTTANSQNQTQTNQSTTNTKTFKSDKYGYTLEYPASWTVASEMQQSTEVVTLKAPGTVTTEQPIGGYTTDKGAVVSLDVSGCQGAHVCGAPEVYSGPYSSAVKNKSKFTLANGIEADRYTFAWESEPALYTVFSKNGKGMTSYLTSEGDELTSPYLNDYNNILNSIKF